MSSSSSVEFPKPGTVVTVHLSSGAVLEGELVSATATQVVLRPDLRLSQTYPETRISRSHVIAVTAPVPNPNYRELPAAKQVWADTTTKPWPNRMPPSKS